MHPILLGRGGLTMRRTVSYLVAFCLALSVAMFEHQPAIATQDTATPGPSHSITAVRAFNAMVRNTTSAGSVPTGRHRGATSVKSEELVGLRTQYATVFAQNDGTYREVVSNSPVHYKDANGTWQNIDNTLVPSRRSGYATSNKANSMTVDFPPTLAKPIVLTSDGGTVSFQPVGASATGSSDGTMETYAGAWPGVTLEYWVASTELKESIILGSAGAAATQMSFLVSMPAGESLKQVSNGAIEVLNSKSVVLFVVPAPSMEDAHFGKASATDSLSMKVALRVRQDPTGTYIDVLPDAPWLSAPGRAWPVTIDPTYSLQPSNDCEIASNTSSAFCPPSDVLQVGNYNAFFRTLLMFQPSLEWVSTVLNAQVGLYLISGSSQSPIEAHALTRSWTNQVTWNTYDGTHSWTTPGGDYNSTPEWTCCSSMTSGNWYTWDITNLTQNWVQGKTSEFGVLFKNANENLQLSVSNFATTTNPNANLRPYLTIVYSPNMGLTAQYTQDTLRLTDHAFSASNIGNGNELVGLHLFDVRGVGQDLSLDAHWNSFFNRSGWDLGWGWSLSTGYDVGTDTWDYPDGAVFYDSTGQFYRFALNGSSYLSPPGINATFANAGGGIYTLTYHATSAVMTFNSGGWLTKETDRNGNAITFLYDSNGALSSITDTEGRVTTFSYSPTGNCGATASGVITSITDSASRTYSFAYDFTKCLLLSYADPQNGAAAPITFAYDGYNNVQTVTDNKGNITRYAYQPLNVTDAGWISSVSRVYDSQGDAYTTTYVDGIFPQYLSYAGTQAVYDASNHQWRYTFDANNLLTQKIDPLGHSRSLAYDGNYDLTQSTDALNQVTGFTYDANFNLTRMQFPASRSGQTAASVNFGYQAPGHTYLPSSSTDALGNCGSMAYDPSGNLIYTYSGQSSPCDGHTGGTSICDAYQNDASGTCGATSMVSCPGAKPGELCWAQDADGHRTNFAYDPSGNLVSVTPPSPMGATQITVDSLSRTTSITDAKGQKTTFSHDNLDRIVQILYAGTTSCSSSSTCTTFTWDVNGNLVTRVDVTGTTTYAYDKLNRLVTKSLPDASTNCAGQSGIITTYDAVDNLAEYCDSGGHVLYGFDAANRNTVVVEPGGTCSPTPNLCTILSYDNDNRLTSVTFPGGATQGDAYDNAGNLTSVIGKDSQNHVITSFSYAYTQGTQDLNVRLSMTESDPLANLTTSYTYDTLGRLTQASNSQTTLTYGYDPAGNRTTGPGGASTFNGANEITSSPGVSSYGFDADGNLTTSSSGTSLTYNAKNQTSAANWGGFNLTGVSYAGAGQAERSNAGSTSFGNGSLGLSISKTSGSSTYFLRDAGGGLLGERTPDGNHWYYLTDALGSIVAVINGAGSSVPDRYSYDPYGKQTYASATVANPWGFAGGYTDPTGLVLFGERYYDPSLGRFTQVEPGSLVPEFSYAADNPINFSDPSGEVMVCELGDGGGASSGGGGAGGFTPPTFFWPRSPITPYGSPNRTQVGQSTPATDIAFAKGKGGQKGGKKGGGTGKTMPKPPELGDGFIWRGPGLEGSEQGGWFNPETGDWVHPHPDSDHGDHYDRGNRIRPGVERVFP